MKVEKTGALRLLILFSLLVLILHVTATAEACQRDAIQGLGSGTVKAQAGPNLVRPTISSRPEPVRPKHAGTPAVHDVAVVQVSTSQVAVIGTILRVNSTIVNYGTVTEHPMVQLLVNGTLAGQDPSVTVASHSAAGSRIDWNTTNYSPGVYSLVVKVLPVPGEQVITNNILPPILVTLYPRVPLTPSSPLEPSQLISRELVLAVAIAETLVVSLFVIGRRLAVRSFFSRLRRLS